MTDDNVGSKNFINTFLEEIYTRIKDIIIIIIILNFRFILAY